MAPASTLRASLAAVLTFALTFGTLTLVTVAPAAADTTQITSGSVTWGLKESWRKYIGDGSQAGDGATITAWSADGKYPEAFRFPIESGSYDSETRTTTLTLEGSVHFRSWYGQVTPGKWALDTKFSDLRLTVGPKKQEIRGTHTGYLRSDPGGELHVDPDVVLATLDVSSPTTSFTAEASSWRDVPAVAGPGFSIYGEGTTLDPVSIDYTGPGGVPDLTETFDRPGVPVMRESGRWLSGSSDSGLSTVGRALEVSPKGDLVYTVEASPTVDDKIVVRAHDAATLAVVGSPLLQDTAPESKETGRFVRTAIDPATDTLFLVTGRDGEDGTQTTVRSAQFDRATKTFSTRVVGRLPDGDVVDGNVGAPAVGSLTWNVEKKELAVVADDGTRGVAADRLSLYRFSLEGTDWTRTVQRIELPRSGDLATATEFYVNGPSSETNADPALAALGDGSYVLATGASIGQDAAGENYAYLPALHLDPSGGASIAATPIAGTKHTTDVFGTYYGYDSAVAGPDGTVVLHGTGQSVEDYVSVTVKDGTATAGTVHRGKDVLEPYGYSLYAASMAYDAKRGLTWATDNANTQGEAIHLVRPDGTSVGYKVPDYATYNFGRALLRVGTDGSLYVPVRKGTFGYTRLAFGGVTPQLTKQPTSTSIDLEKDESDRTTTLSVQIDPDLGGDLQWQVKRVGESRFSDVVGAHDTSLSVKASPATDGSSYRVLVENAAGTVASDVADLTVRYGPRFTVQPRDVSTTPGTIANFNAEVDANPAVTSTTWQRKVGGFWQDVGTDDDNLTVGEGSLRVDETAIDQSGTSFRLKAVSPRGTTYSSPATLTVKAKEAQAGPISGATLQWSGSQEMQKAPPFGGSSFFSAGESNGKEPTYLARQGSVSVFQVADGQRTLATWATRAEHVDSDDSTRQLVTVEGGTGRLKADGSATIAWKGSWSVNFYGGLVPFTVSDPVLSVDADGDGTLTADLSGYASSQDNPDERTKVEPVEDVVVATFDDVRVDSTGFSVAPDYDGVEVDLPSSATPQQRSGTGWGSWPQSFVDFHLRTGLSSYWYSSGGAADPDKGPSPLQVGAFDVDTDPEVVAPRIVVQPSSLHATIRTAAEFGVTATGTDLRYQWQRKLGSTWVDVSDATASSLRLRWVVTADNGTKLRVRVSNVAGSVTSSAASLTVSPARTSARISASRASQAYKATRTKRAVVTVKVSASNGSTAHGTVRFYDGRKRIGTVRTTGGVAKLRTPSTLKRGKHRLTATYTPHDKRLFATARTKGVTIRVR